MDGYRVATLLKGQATRMHPLEAVTLEGVTSLMISRNVAYVQIFIQCK